MQLKKFIQVCLVILLAVSVQAQDQSLFCDQTVGRPTNIVTSKVLDIPEVPDYTHSSSALFGSKVYEVLAQNIAGVLTLQVIRQDFTICTQSKPFDSNFEIVVVKNEIVIVKFQSLENSQVFTYSAFIFDFGNLDQDSSEITMYKDFVLPAELTGFTPNMLLGFVQSTLTLSIVFGSGKVAKVYQFVFTTQAMTLVGTLTSDTDINIVGGWSGLIFDDKTGKFYTLSGTTYNAVEASTIVGTKGFYPLDLNIGSTERQTVAFLSRDSATTKATLILSSVSGDNVIQFPAGASSANFHCDDLSNFVVWSDVKVVWFNVQFQPNQELLYSAQQNATSSPQVNQLVADFKDSLAGYTSNQRGFLMGQTTIKYLKIWSQAGNTFVTKLKQVALESTFMQLFLGQSDVIVGIRFECKCATPGAQKLICFAVNFNCLAVSKRSVRDCTDNVQ